MRRSRRNRRLSAELDGPSRSTFKATRRPRSSCSARKTVPMPPRPIRRTIRYGPTSRPSQVASSSAEVASLPESTPPGWTSSARSSTRGARYVVSVPASGSAAAASGSTPTSVVRGKVRLSLSAEGVISSTGGFEGKRNDPREPTRVPGRAPRRRPAIAPSMKSCEG